MSRMVLFIFFWLLFVAVDWYVYRGLRISFPLQDKPMIRWLSIVSYWIVPLFLTILVLVFINKGASARVDTRWILAFTGIFILFYVPKIILVLFNLLSDAWNGITWILKKLSMQNSNLEGGLRITRGDFLRLVGTFVAILPFASVLYGILFGRFDYKIEKQSIKSSKLNGTKKPIRIVQISDAHLGSFLSKPKPVQKAIEAINELQPDVIVFTGDLVNDRADEAEFWIPYFKSLKAKYGKFSILGNHDYGDYVKWESEAAKKQNLDRLKAIHSEMDFKLLLNEHQDLHINEGHIHLSGVENWGLPPFPQFGNLNKALEKANGENFNLLLSHDPTHFDEEVCKHPVKPDLTLSGHTHGMQFGLILGSFKWSPVQYRYKKWAGLYERNQQKLYVNRGFGYIGFPGRVGMPPEITLFELEGEN